MANRITPEEMKSLARAAEEAPVLAGLFAQAWDAYWDAEDALYDHDFGSPEYLRQNALVQEWQNLANAIGGKILRLFLREDDSEEALGAFMNKHGYIADGGAWIKP